jgi:hypothetical protein
MRPLTKAEMKALEEVVKYMMDAEQRHYEESAPDEKEHHIYKEVLKLIPILTDEGVEI